MRIFVAMFLKILQDLQVWLYFFN